MLLGFSLGAQVWEVALRPWWGATSLGGTCIKLMSSFATH